MLFKVKSGEDLRYTNDGIDSVLEFVPLCDDELRYIFLMWDYDSPYRNLPIKSREGIVLASMGYGDEKKVLGFFGRVRKDRFDLAVSAFKKMQFSPKHESLLSTRHQICEWNDLMMKDEKTEREMVLIAKIFDKMPDYIKRLDELEELVGYKEKVDIVDERTSLELYFENKEGYR